MCDYEDDNVKKDVKHGDAALIADAVNDCAKRALEWKERALAAEAALAKLPTWLIQGAALLGQTVYKAKGAEWHGEVVGVYHTAYTEIGLCVESSIHRNSVQIYPATSMMLVMKKEDDDDDNPGTGTIG